MTQAGSLTVREKSGNYLAKLNVLKDEKAGEHYSKLVNQLTIAELDSEAHYRRYLVCSKIAVEHAQVQHAIEDEERHLHGH